MKLLNFKEYIKSDMVLEYLQPEANQLYRYFQMSDAEKSIDATYTFSYLFNDFLDDIGEDFDSLDIPSNLEDYEIPEHLAENNPKLLKQFGNWLFVRIEEHSLDIPNAEYPSWSFFSNPKIIKNQWLIHFTNKPYQIAKEGFKYGIYDISNLGLTTHYTDSAKQYGGYNFAYDIDDFDKYYSTGFRNKYGDSAVLFRASGVKVWHNSDEESQVIFYGKYATNIIPIESGEDKEFGIYSNKTKRLLFESDELTDITEWIDKNHFQYRKHL